MQLVTSRYSALNYIKSDTLDYTFYYSIPLAALLSLYCFEVRSKWMWKIIARIAGAGIIIGLGRFGGMPVVVGSAGVLIAIIGVDVLIEWKEAGYGGSDTTSVVVFEGI